jgi:predicted nucleic acid-binding Zn ribbon protein
MKSKNKSEAVGKVLTGVVSDNGWAIQLDLHSIFPRWADLVGKELADNTRPLKIERRVLWLEVDNSAWLQQLQYQKLELLDILNGVLRLSQLRDIKMLLPKGGGKPSAPPPPKVRFVRPSREKVEAFRHQIAVIEDEQCREALMQFWYLSQACRNDNK